MHHNKYQIKTALGIVGVVVAVLGLAMTAQAQTESYITDADEAAACEGVCNTYVPPQTEAECRALYQERWEEEYLRNFNALIRLANRKQAELDASHDIYHKEWVALKAVYDERVAIARAVCATRIAGATSAYAYCLASITATGGAGITAAALCSGVYASACAGFIVAMKREFSDAAKDFNNEERIAREDWDDRDSAINALYDKREANENARNQSQLALIEEDLRLCLERVNN